jgi:hypothetical protein
VHTASTTNTQTHHVCRSSYSAHMSCLLHADHGKTQLHSLTVAFMCAVLGRCVLQARLAALPWGVGMKRRAPFHHITPQPAGTAITQHTCAEAVLCYTPPNQSHRHLLLRVLLLQVLPLQHWQARTREPCCGLAWLACKAAAARPCGLQLPLLLLLLLLPAGGCSALLIQVAWRGMAAAAAAAAAA